MLLPLLTLCLAASLTPAPAAPPVPEAPPGARVPLTDGQLFIPEGYRPEADGLTVTLHLHGATWAAERNFVRARRSGVAVTTVLPGLSAVYARKFSDPAAFQRILAETREKLAERHGGKAPEVRRVAVTSFSAGFGGVRELLRDPGSFRRIDALVMADSIYSGFEGDPAERKVSAEDMEGFLRFAREAVAGRKAMIVTHTALRTPTYASTGETADYLLRKLELQREVAEEEWEGGLRLRTRAGKGGLAVYGFEGETGPEHMKHLHGLWQFLGRLANVAKSND